VIYIAPKFQKRIGAHWVVAWCSGYTLVGLDQRSCSTPGTVTTWMLTGKPSRYVTRHLGQFSLLSFWGR